MIHVVMETDYFAQTCKPVRSGTAEECNDWVKTRMKELDSDDLGMSHRGINYRVTFVPPAVEAE